jgi:hypothetical protein
MSNFIQVQQPVGRVDPDALCSNVDLDADLRGQGNQDLSAPPDYDEPAAAGTALYPIDLSDRFTLHRFHGAPYELVVIEATRLEGLQLPFGHPQFLPCEPLHIFDPRESFEPYNRPAALYAGSADCQRRIAGGTARLHRGASPKPLADEIRFRIDHDLPADPVRPGNTPDQHEVFPGHALNPGYRAAPARRAAPP